MVFRSLSHWLVLIVLYITALVHADLLHAVYLALFVALSINARVCQRYWFILVSGTLNTLFVRVETQLN